MFILVRFIFLAMLLAHALKWTMSSWLLFVNVPKPILFIESNATAALPDNKMIILDVCSVCWFYFYDALCLSIIYLFNSIFVPFFFNYSIHSRAMCSNLNKMPSNLIENFDIYKFKSHANFFDWRLNKAFQCFIISKVNKNKNKNDSNQLKPPSSVTRNLLHYFLKCIITMFHSVSPDIKRITEKCI